MIYDLFEVRVLTPEERTIIQHNAQWWDRLREKCPLRCGNPYCQWPLPLMDNFRLLEYGDVCELCYDLSKILSESAYWNRIQLDEKPKKQSDGGGLADYRG